MDPVSGFFEKEAAKIINEAARLHKVLVHLRYEGKPTRGKNLKAAKSSILSFSKILKGHRELQEKVVFPYLRVHIPKHDPAIRFFCADHRAIRRDKEKLRSLIGRASKKLLEAGKFRGIQKKGAYLAGLVRHHLELERKSVLKAIRNELRPEEKKEIFGKVTFWLRKSSMRRRRAK